MTITILVTGFGPFPGAPFNPTGPLVSRLARTRRPALADVTIVPHVFPTSYTAVDRDLQRLLVRHRPHALLMFGLAPREKKLRIETRARNALTLLPDASGQSLRRHSIVRGGPAVLALPAHVCHLFAAARAARLPIVISRDAGRYLCNYLCWRAAESTAHKNRPSVAAFVHVPPVARVAHRRSRQRRLTLDDLTRGANRLLVPIAAAARR